MRYRGTGRNIIELDSGQKYEFLWCGQNKRRDKGVGFLIKQDKQISYSDPDFQNPRIMSMNVNVYGFKVRAVCVYSPTNCDGTQQMKDDFYRDIRKATKIKEKNRKLIVLGDFNAQTNVVYSKTNFGSNSIIEDVNCNENGYRLKSYCRAAKLNMIQTFFDVPIEKRYTWYSNDRITKKILDYVLVDSYVLKYAKMCEVHCDADIDSDHRLLVCTLTTPRTKRARWSPKKVIKGQPNPKELLNSDIRAKFERKIEDEFQACEETKANILSEKLVRSLNEIAEDVIPKMAKTKNRQTWRDDDVFNSLLQARSNCTKGSAEWKKATKLIKTRVRKLRNEKLALEAKEINIRASQRKIEELFRCFKNENSSFHRKTNHEECDPSRLKEHFKNHFNILQSSSEPTELSKIPDFVLKLQSITIDGIDTSAPKAEELLSVIKSLKGGKSASDLPTEYIKYAISNETVLQDIIKLFQDIWETKVVPQNWSHTKLKTIWKGSGKGKISDPKAHRGIQIGSTLCKILVTIVLRRLSKWYEEQLSDQQQGFRRGRGTAEGIYLLKRLQQISKNRKKPCYVLFVDLSAAFDHVNRHWMFLTISQRLSANENKTLFQLLESIYRYTTTELIGGNDDIFKITTGVRQGGPESPTLFNLYIDYIMRVFLYRARQKGIRFVKTSYSIPGIATLPKKEFGLGNYGEFEFNWIGYADDLVLAFEDLLSLELGLKLLDCTLKEYGMNLNIGKTKTMIFNFLGENYPPTLVSLDSQPIENETVFQYLGSFVHREQTTTGDEELNLRIDSADTKFYSLGKKLMNFRICLKTRVLMLNALVRSRLTYACQAWTLTERQLSRVSSVYMGWIRRMTRNGFKRKENSYAYVYTNEQLLEMAGTEHPRKFIRKLQRSFTAHIIRRNDTELLKRVLFNSEKVQVQGRQINLWDAVLRNEGCTETDFINKAITKVY